MFFRPVYWVIAVLALVGGACLVAYGVKGIWLGYAESAGRVTDAYDLGVAGLVVMAMGFWFVRQARDRDDGTSSES